MRPNFIFTFLLFLTTCIGAFSQKTNNSRGYCYTDEIFAKSLELDPTLKEKMDERDNAINDFSKNILSNPLYNFPSPANSATAVGVNLVIPVVVYIVHDSGPENISDQQVISQIDRLNDEFSGHGVQFCLATTEGSTPLPGSSPNPGIIRVQSGLTDHLVSSEVALKNLSTLSGVQYLRIWVVKDIDNGSGTLGYARPKGPWITDNDGVVMRYDAFGDEATCGCTNLLPSNDQGKVLVHEVGHYLGLYHTFHGGCIGMTSATCNIEGDRVCDTPPVATANYGCPAPGSINSCSETPNSPDLLDNHMDYTNDMCRTSFTTGQETRMISMINLFYVNLVSSNNLVYTGIQCNGGLLAVYSVDNYNPCDGDVVTLTANTVAGGTYTWDFGDGSPIVTGNPITHSYSTGGVFYPVTLTVNDGTNTASETQQIYVSDCSPIYSSQGNWYFYKNAGLNFSSGSPVANDAAWVNNTMSGSVLGEACAVQSNNNGDLLFYTDAIHIWDENHNQINVGNELTGFHSSSRGTMSVPSPANSNEYYIFTSSTISGFNHPNSNKGLRYSKVLVTGTSASLTTTVNEPVLAPSGFLSGDNGAIYVSEGITAIASCDGYWIICNGKIGNNKCFVVYELTSSGISYNSYYEISANNDNYTGIEASPDGSKIALSQFSGSPWGTYLYNFDKYTGVVSGETVLSLSSQSMGLSFSPNSQILYRTSGAGLYQYDLTVGNPVAFLVASGYYYGQLQAGPDQKIYSIRPFTTKLAVIHQPNVVSTTLNPNACGFSVNGPDLNTAASGIAIDGGYGLPNMIDANTMSVFSNTISYTSTSCFTHQFTANICTSTYSWDFGDPASGLDNTSTLQSPTHIFSSPGTYTVTVNAGGTTITETVDVGFDLSLSGPTVVCLQNTSVYNYSVSGAGSPASSLYSWSATGGAVLGLNGQDNIDVNWTSLPGSVTVNVFDLSTSCSETITFSVDENCSSCFESISYQTGQHTTVVSGDLVKTSGGSTWSNSGVGRAQSVETVSSGEYIEWEITGTSVNDQKGVMLGLSYSIPTTSTWNTVDYALYNYFGNYQIYENGVSVPLTGGTINVQAGDIMRIERDSCNGNNIIYKINGVEVGSTVDPNPTSIMEVEIAMGYLGNRVHNLVKDCLPECPCLETVSYQTGQHTTVVSGDLIKTSGGSTWSNSGVGRAQSDQVVSSGEYIEWEITGTSFNDQRGLMLGLSYSIPTTSTWNTVDHSLYYYNGNYQIFENGASMPLNGGSIAVQAGDILRIERNNCDGNNITYKINGVEVRSTVDPSPTSIMEVEIAMGYQGNRVHNLIKDCLPECPCLESISYQTGQHTTVVSGDLVKTSGGSTWSNSGVGRAQSDQEVSSGEYIEWEITGTSVNDQRGVMLGLSYSIPTTSTWNTVDYALYNYFGYYQIYENGVSIPLNGGQITVQTGDIMRIERDSCNGNNIIYKINGIEVGSTVDPSPTSIMEVEIAMGYLGNTVHNLIKDCIPDCLCLDSIEYETVQHTTVVSGDLVKTSGGSSWANSGVGRAESIESVSSGEYLEWEITGTSVNDQKGVMLGLSYSIPATSTWNTVDYALYNYWGNYQIYENGVSMPLTGGIINVQAGDIMRIERNNCNGDNIIYKINGIQVRSIVDPSPASVMDVEIALGYQGNRVHNLIKDCIPECPCLETVSFQAGQHTTVVSGNLVKTSGGSSWTNTGVGRAQGDQMVSPGEYIEWEITGTSFNDQKGLMLGLSYTIPTTSSYNTVDHALYFYNNYQIYENGVSVLLTGGTISPQVGDILRIERNDCNGNNIVYKINDVEVGSTVDPNPATDMKVEIAMGYQGNRTHNLIKGCFADCDLVPEWTSSIVSNFTFSLSGSNNGSTCSSLQYNWEIFDSSGNLVTSFSGQNPPNVQLFMTDVYQVCLTINQLDVNGDIMCSESTCGDLPADFTIANPRLNENQSSNLPENIDLVKVIAVPNPSTNQVSFILENNDLDERNGELTLYDIQGKMIIQQQISLSEGYKVDVSSLASGMYYYKVTISGRESEIDKLVIQNH